MIHEIGKEIGASLAAKGCPFRVVDGPEPTQTSTYARERIVLEHDEDAGDSFGPVVSQHKNPQSRMTRRQGFKLTIYAQSTAAGSLEFEHRRRAEHVLDMVLIAIDDVAKVRRNGYVISSGRFVQPADLAKSEVIGGAVYELKFTFDRSVNVQTWPGAARPTTTLDAVDNVTQVTGPDHNTPEVAEAS